MEEEDAGALRIEAIEFINKFKREVDGDGMKRNMFDRVNGDLRNSKTNTNRCEQK